MGGNGNEKWEEEEDESMAETHGRMRRVRKQLHNATNA